MKKKKFWITVAILFAILLLLIMFLPKSVKNVLTIETDDGQSVEINLKSLQQRKGIDFKALSNSSEEYEGEESKYIVGMLLNWYNRYIEDNKKNLLKVYEFDQILHLAEVQYYDYHRLEFYSGDNARVVVEPKEHKDNIILIALEKESGYLKCRLIMPEDNFSQRWLKDIVRIVVK